MPISERVTDGFVHVEDFVLDERVVSFGDFG